MSKALIVVDVQRDFCEGGSLPVTGGAAVAGRISELLTGDHGYAAVVATRDHHIDPGGHFAADPDFVDSWPRHCVVGTGGVEFHDQLRFREFDAVFDKGEYAAAYSGFEGRDAAAPRWPTGCRTGEWSRLTSAASRPTTAYAPPPSTLPRRASRPRCCSTSPPRSRRTAST